jgi:hypothetical protein
MNSWTDTLAQFSGVIRTGADFAPGEIACPRYSEERGVEVYRNNYRGNLHDALAGAYPVIRQLVGEDFFRLLARRFIEAHPSRSGNLHRYGAEMASFVASFEPAQGLPYLADVAALEWACHCAYFADDTTTFDIAFLAQIPAERYPDMVLHIHPECRLVHSRYPIAAIWQAHQPGADADFRIDLDSGSCNALVSRKDDVVLVNELTDADTAWFQYMQANTRFEEATVATLGRYPDFDLQAALLKLAAQNVISDFTLGEEV